jgi:hypothetical protein
VLTTNPVARLIGREDTQAERSSLGSHSVVVSNQGTDLVSDARGSCQMDRVERSQHQTADLRRSRQDGIDGKQSQTPEDPRHEQRRAIAQPARRTGELYPGERAARSIWPPFEFAAQGCGLRLDGDQLDQRRRVQVDGARAATRRHGGAMMKQAEGRARERAQLSPGHPDQDRAGR